MTTLSSLLRQTAEALEKAAAEGGPLHSGAIEVWSWEFTPEWVRTLIVNQSGVDWVAFVPDLYRTLYVPVLESFSLGPCRIVRHQIAGGYLVVGYHA